MSGIQAEMMMKTNIVRRKSLVQNSIPPIISSNSQRRELYTKGKPLWFNIDGESRLVANMNLLQRGPTITTSLSNRFYWFIRRALKLNQSERLME